jgi:release factor glutamine methyltransferase
MNKTDTWQPLDIIQWTTNFFADKGIPNPRLDAELLLAHILKCSRVDLYVNHEKVVTPEEREKFKHLMQRRATREPLQYILKNQEFWGLALAVSVDVLIPRPETELMIEWALKLFPDPEGTYIFLDIGTGSGCVALALAFERPKAHIIATDISEAALALAKKNAQKLGLAERIDFVLTDLTHKKAWQAAAIQFDGILSNPPYIAHHEFETLQPEVRDYEPQSALHGGKSGLDFYPRIFQDAYVLLKEGGHVLVEIGEGQAPQVVKMAQEVELTEVMVHKDFQGNPRTLQARKK